jgi:hypothetical protein
MLKPGSAPASQNDSRVGGQLQPATKKTLSK